MNYIELAIWGITGSALILGIILGAVRGANRSVLRLVLVLICVVAAYFARESLTNLVLEIKVGENTVQDTLINMLGPDFAELGGTVIILVSVLASVLIFILTFYLLKFLTWLIVFPLCKLFVKKGKNKHPVLGGLIGLVQGAVVALCICIPLSGLVAQTHKLMASVGEAQDAFANVESDGNYAYAAELEDETDDSDQKQEGDEPEKPDDGDDVDPGYTIEPADPDDEGGSFIPKEYLEMMSKYENSFMGKLYCQKLKKPFTWISTVRVGFVDEETGETTTKKYSLEGQIDAVTGAIRMVKEFAALKNIDWSTMEFTGDIAKQIQDILKNIQSVKNELSQESIDTINKVIGGLVNKVDLPFDVDASGFDIGKVDFAKEGDLIVQVVESANDPNFTSEDLKKLTESLTESTLVMPMLDTIKGTVDLPDGKQEMFQQAFDDLEAEGGDYNQEVLDKLRSLFGLSGGSSAQPAE